MGYRKAFTLCPGKLSFVNSRIHMKKNLLRNLLVFTLALCGSNVFIGTNTPNNGVLYGQSTHSNVKNKDLLKRFRVISDELMCSCGCSLPLDYCNHVDHCNAWPMRQAIDILLQEGQSDEFIIDGFINGFKEIVDTSPAFKLARSPEYDYLLTSFRDGFGEKQRTHPKGHRTGIPIGIGILIILGTTFLFLRRHYKKLNKKKDTKTTMNKKESDDLYNKLYDD